MKKRLISLIMAVVMMLSLCTAAFAAEATTTVNKPTNSTSAVTPVNITSVTVNGTAASYYCDSNTDAAVYIRAIVAGTEYNLQNATVVITTTGETVEVDLGDTEIEASGVTGNTYTYNMDLLNKAYTVNVGDDDSYTLAAGLNKTTSPIALPANDPMRIAAMSIGGATASIQMSVVNNPFMGNPYYTMWTSVSYTVTAAMEGSTTRSALNASITLPSGASAPTTDSCLTGNAVTGTGAATTCTLDLTGSTILKVVYGGYSRNYTVIATDANTISVNIGIDFTEALDSTQYKTDSDVKARVDKLIEESKIYFGNGGKDATGEELKSLPTHGVITVPAGSTVMDVMHQFAVKYGYTSEVPEGCTYMATLNGVGEFTFGSMSGWMYSNNPTWDETGDALYTTWNTPPVGGASYVLTNGETVCWFICTNYVHHPWN